MSPSPCPSSARRDNIPPDAGRGGSVRRLYERSTPGVDSGVQPLHLLQPNTCTWGLALFCERSNRRAVRTSSGSRSALQTGHVRRRDDGGRHRGHPDISMILPCLGERRMIDRMRSPGPRSAPQSGHGQRRPPPVELAPCPAGSWSPLFSLAAAARGFFLRGAVRTRTRMMTPVARARTAAVTMPLMAGRASILASERTANGSSSVGTSMPVCRGERPERSSSACGGLATTYSPTVNRTIGEARR